MAEMIVPMDDKEMFEAAIAPEPVATPAPPAEPERPRDELGRFAPKEQEEASAQPAEQPKPVAQEQPPPEQPKDDQAGQVPSWRLREEREAREAEKRRADELDRERATAFAQMQAMERRLAELSQPKQEPIDIYADPEGAFKQRIDPVVNGFQQEIIALRLEVSRDRAERRYTVETVDKMEKALEQAVQRGDHDTHALVAQMRASRDPVGLAMNWYNNKTVQETTGGDLEAYVKKRIEDALKDPATQAKAIEVARAAAGAAVSNGTRPSPIQLPPSLGSLPGSAASLPAGHEGASDQELFSHATQGMRR